MGNNMVNVKIINSAYSIADEYYEINKTKATSKSYKNPGLSSKGYETIFRSRNVIKDYIGNPDIIISSPLKRAIQTCLLVFNSEITTPIRLVPLVTEFENIIENKGNARNILKIDPELIGHINFKNIDFSNDKNNLLYYDFGWRRVFESGWENDSSKIKVLDKSLSWFESDNQIILNEDMRIETFKEFLSNSEFSSKTIVIFSHTSFIKKLFNKFPDNLATVSFTFDQKTKNIKLNEIIDFELISTHNKDINVKKTKYLKMRDPNYDIVSDRHIRMYKNNVTEIVYI
jgi:hypothetical protein